MHMKNTKIIGITASGGRTCKVNAQYVKGIVEAGGTPLLLAPVCDAKRVAELVSLCDGILLTGGADVDPSAYGEERIAECGSACIERDNFEIALIKEALRADKAIFGICRGSQILNVALGGTLWQDIPSQCKESISHKRSDEDPAKHAVRLEREELVSMLGTSGMCFDVNSYHHQAVNRVGNGLCVLARAEGDRMVEGIYHPERKFVLGVQWHPELWIESDENAMALFNAFVKAI